MVLRNNKTTGFRDGKLLMGFTIIEVVISVSVGILLLLVAVDLLISVSTSPKSQIISMGNIEQAKTAVSTFANELRNAAIGNGGSYSITEAENNEIIFYSNYRTEGNLVYRMRYYLSGDTLYRGVTIPTGSPLSYDLGSEVVKPVVTVVSNGSDPAFYYYDGSYNGSSTYSPLYPPININMIRFVKISMVIKNQITNQDNSTFPISAGVAVRNLKDNLGN